MKIKKQVMLSVFLLMSIFQHYAFSQGTLIQAKGYDKATYNLPASGKFMKTWLVAGPIPVSNDTLAPSDAMQEKAFKSDVIAGANTLAGRPPAPVSINGRDFNWQLITSGADIVDLDSFYKNKDFVYAYALAEIKANAPTNMVLGLGSDDGIKVWLNGKLIHDNWIPRGVDKDNDLVQLKLVKGSNQLLLKIQDMKGGWGFVARLLDKAALTSQLTTEAANGNVDKIKLLIDGGADINAGNASGITPVVAAKIRGRKDIADMLLKQGAKDETVPKAEILIDNFYTSLKGKEAPGIAVLVAREGDVLYRKGFGYADVKNKVPVTPDTKFRIGSVTKQFTAAAILKLQEKNLLSVNDKLSKFIPDFPRGDEVTIHQLLTHTSGIHSYTGKDDFVEKVTNTVLPDTLINSFKNDPYDFNPGEKMLYNNSGYFLLGYIIGKVSGKPYEAYLKETFFDPLGMKNTGVHYAAIKLEHEAKGYSKNKELYEPAKNWDMSWAGGAGAIYSTVDDLLKWNIALHNGKVLNEQSWKAATTPAVLKNGEPPAMKYGYGLIFNNFRGVDIISHSGGLHGFLTQLAYYPKEKMTVVMFVNTSEPEVNFDPNKIAETFLWDKMDKQTSYIVSSTKPKNLQLYTGRFEISNVGVLTVTTADDKLFAQISGQPKFEIFPLADDEFFWKVVEARLKFFKDEKGMISHTVLFQNGMELKGQKLPEEHIVEINPAILDNYIGKYKFKNLVLTITKENDKLFVEPAGQSKQQMLPTSDTDFVIKEINAKISFVKDKSGKVNMFKLNMNNTNSEVPRIKE
ncbi:MAG: serine hydrolase [Ferruginibacter sp.]